MQNDFNAWINHYNLEFAHKEELNKAWVYCYTHLSPSQRPQIIKFIRDLGADFCMERWDALVKFKEMNSHNNGVSLGFFIAKFGDIKGPILHKELSAKVKDNSPSKKKMIENYGEELGLQKWQELCNSRSGSLENFIWRHGEELGTEKYIHFCERNKGNHTLERKLEKMPQEEAEIAYSKGQYKLKNKNYLEYYIELYGEEEGTQRFDARRKKQSYSIKNTKKEMVWKIGTPTYKRWLEATGNMQYNDEEKKAIKRYYYDVWRVTKKQPLHLLPNFDKRGQQSVKDSFAVDHRISIMYGFRNKISAEEIGNINNLQMLPHTLNSSKCDNCYSVLDYCLHYTIGEENE